MISDPCLYLSQEICYKGEDVSLDVTCINGIIKIKTLDRNYELNIKCSYDYHGPILIFHTIVFDGNTVKHDEKEFRGTQIYEAIATVLDLIRLGKLHTRLKRMINGLSKIHIKSRS